MGRYVDITFECLPLRSVTRLDPPMDASPGFRAFCERIKAALAKHGSHNTYYLHNARCAFHLTNDEKLGTLEFRFEGTVITDSDDRNTVIGDLDVQLRGETCDWLTEPAVAWFGETVRQAVLVEFNQFAAAGDLERTRQRMARVAAESDSHGGYLGMGL